MRYADSQHLLLMCTLQDGASSSAGSSLPAKRTTTAPEPFNLTQPRPKPPPQEEVTGPAIKARPAPRHASGPTREQRALEEACARNRQLQEERQVGSSTHPLATVLLAGSG